MRPAGCGRAVTSCAAREARRRYEDSGSGRRVEMTPVGVVRRRM